MPGERRVVGYIADPKCDRGNAKLQYLFVNGRWFRDRSLAHALQDSYRGLLMTGRYTIGFLFLTVPPDQVDVNVHPTKAEVRFQENSLIYSLVRATVKERLQRENLVPSLTVPVGHNPEELAWRGSPANGEPVWNLVPPAPPVPSLWSAGHDHGSGTADTRGPDAPRSPSCGAFGTDFRFATGNRSDTVHGGASIRAPPFSFTIPISFLKPPMACW